MVAFVVVVVSDGVVLSVTVGDWSTGGEVAIRRQRRARVGLLGICGVASLLTSLLFGSLAWTIATSGELGPAGIGAGTAVGGVALAGAWFVVLQRNPGGRGFACLSSTLVAWTLISTVVVLDMAAAASILG